jgi:translation initiation factor IF-3
LRRRGRWSRGDNRRRRVRVNRRIRVPKVRVIGSDGEQIGVLPTHEALDRAMEEELDLVEVSPNADPPVCRIMDYGKFMYEQSKKESQAKKKQHVVHLKEIKLRPKIEEHDYQFKKNHAEKFLTHKDKVKVTVLFRGREMDHRELGKRIMDRMAEDLSHVGTVERPALMEGRIMVMILAPLTGRIRQSKSDGGESHAEDENS